MLSGMSDIAVESPAVVAASCDTFPSPAMNVSLARLSTRATTSPAVTQSPGCTVNFSITSGSAEVTSLCPM